ncbi:MAG: cobalamin-dependent protein [Negativicutes bacterium]|nr:cobalamin-dependent protein [Negativicutes bacterium]
MTIFASIEQLQPVSAAASGEYTKKTGLIRASVNETLTGLENIHSLTGNCPLKTLHDIHRHHTLFLSSVFRLSNYTLLAKMIVWMYRAYPAHGFSHDYFTAAFSAWRMAVRRQLSESGAAEVDRIYEWMADHHGDFVRLAKSADYQVFSDNKAEAVYGSFLIQLLQGDYQGCLAFGERYLNGGSELASFYVDVIEASMYEIGRLWETGQISVAQEHLATAVVTRVMLSLFLRYRPGQGNSAKAVIAAVPSEFHEVGGRMAADLLERHGWDVDYLGVDMPRQDLVRYLQINQPCFVGLAVVMPFNLAAAREIRDDIRRDHSLDGVRIMVGGAAFRHSEDLWRQVGADAYATDGQAAVSIARKWLEEKQSP